MGHALFAGSFFDATAPRKKAKDRGAICATVFFERCFARGFAPEPSFLTIPYCKAQKQDAAGEDEVYELEFPTPLKPLAIADVCRAKADKEDGVGGIDDVGEAVAECKRKHTKLCRHVKHLCKRHDDGNEHKCLCRA